MYNGIQKVYVFSYIDESVNMIRLKISFLIDQLDVCKIQRKIRLIFITFK